MTLVENIYRLTAMLLRSESYGLVSQLQRSAISIPSNIAEGHARDSSKEYLRYISIAMGSLAELETQILISERLNYVTRERSQPLIQNIDEIGKMLRGVQKSLKVKVK